MKRPIALALALSVAALSPARAEETPYTGKILTYAEVKEALARQPAKIPTVNEDLLRLNPTRYRPLTTEESCTRTRREVDEGRKANVKALNKLAPRVKALKTMNAKDAEAVTREVHGLGLVAEVLVMTVVEAPNCYSAETIAYHRTLLAAFQARR